ncbi:MAG: hypothetical protein WED11_00650, partial [Natronospirillum sp.]
MSSSPNWQQAKQILAQVQTLDRYRLQQALGRLQKETEQGRDIVDDMTQWLDRAEQSLNAVATRRQNTPTVRVDESLPVGEQAARIQAAIMAHQVVIVAGETGSGKTTQLPKICLNA